MIIQPELHTQRLLLRSLRKEDALALSVLASDIHIYEMTLRIPHPYHESDALTWIQQHPRKFVAGEAVIYAITLQEPATVMGVISLENIRNAEAALGYWIGFPYWGQGFVTELMLSIMRFSGIGLTINDARPGKIERKSGVSNFQTAQRQTF